MMIKHERTITDDLVDKWREALATPVARKRIKDGKPSTAYVHSELEIPSDDAYPYETRLLNISGKAKELHLSTKSRGDKVSSFFCITSSKQRFTRGYKRYKETSGLMEWKIGHIFHSIFT